MISTIPPAKSKKQDPLVGSVVGGKYRILALVAAGGMGKIYQAEQIALGRSVALKVLHSQNDPERDRDDPQFKKRFLREASILARLQHPNIVTVFDYGAIEGAEADRYFISMEYLSGETLGRRIAERVSLSTRDTIRIARQLARGLTEAHAHGVIHRDLKPSNVMLLPGRDGEDLVKIVDFGIVKIIGDDSQEREELTQEGSFIGSPKYMAPEQITRGGKIDARTDVYSFGIILYQCLTGSVPFDGASSIQTLMAHLNHEPQPMRERSPSADVPDWLDLLVRACIEKDPAKRPQTMDAVARTLADAEATLSASGALSAISARNSSPAIARSVEAAPISRTGPGARVTSGITTAGTISSVHPPAETEKTRTSPGMKQEPAKKRRAVGVGVFFVGAAAIALFGGVTFFGLRHRVAPPPALPPTTVAAPGPLAPTTPSPAPPAPAPRFTLRIESIPPGADVREGDRVLGVTPLELSIDRDAVRAAPRVLSLVKEGFVPYPVTQGPSEEAVHVLAQLTATTPAPSSSTSAHGAAPAGSGRHGSGAGHSGQGTPASSGHPDLDIRMTR